MGVKAIPVHLHGQAELHGMITGSILNPDVKADVKASNFDTVFEQKVQDSAISSASATPSLAPVSAVPVTTATAPGGFTNIHWDSLNGIAEYSPEGVSVQQLTLLSGKTAIHVTGQLHRHRISAKHAPIDDESAIDATVGVEDAPITELLAIVGQSAPVTGSLSLNAKVGGTLGNLNGGGHLSLKGGEIEDVPYRSLNSDLRFSGQELDATNLKFIEDKGQITGDGGYDIRAKTFHFQAQGTAFDLARFPRIQSEKAPLSGELSFEATGSGSVGVPVVQAKLHIAQLTIDKQFRGSLEAKANLNHNAADYDGGDFRRPRAPDRPLPEPDRLGFGRLRPGRGFRHHGCAGRRRLRLPVLEEILLDHGIDLLRLTPQTLDECHSLVHNSLSSATFP